MAYQLTIEPLGETIVVEDEQTLLDAALRQGIWLPHACCHGLCATCKVQVVDGEVDHGAASPFALMDFERSEGKCLACCAIPRSDLVIEADIDDEPDARHLPVQDYSGKVTEIVSLTPTIKGVRIEMAGSGIDFQAGQYVNVKIPGESIPRAFSIASSPSEKNQIELNVRKVPGGKGTAYIHEKLRAGDPIEFSGPYGRFFVRKSSPESALFMAGGSGLSSPKSMIQDLLESGDARDITLIYGARNRGELYYHEYFSSLVKDYPNFNYLATLSEPTEECCWGGVTGFVHEAAKDYFNGDFRGQRAYLCGPPKMIDSCISTLMQGRLFERDIFTEKFFSASDAASLAPRSPLFRSI